MADNRHLEAGFFAVVLLIAIAAVFYILKPFFGVLVIAATLAVIFRPIYLFILKILKNKELIAAFLTVIIVLLAVLMPLAFLGYKIFNEATNLYVSLASGRFNDASAALWDSLKRINDKFNIGITQINTIDYLKQAASWFIQNLGSIFTGVTETFVSIFLGLLGFFYLLKDGGKLKNNLISFLPLSAHHSEEIYSRMESAVNSVIRGAIVIAIIQGITAGIGFMIFGVPNAVFWGALTCFAALVPTIGTALVVFPAAAYLLLHGAMWSGLGLIIWGLLVAGLIDNFLSPQLTKKGVGAHPFLVLLSVLGGITVMGPIGFLAGPLILSFLVALLGIYPELVKKEA